jgi:redox-sensitive bicupin YhaK (pirin superfamily)
VHVATGEVAVNGVPLTAGDGASIEGPSSIMFAGTSDDAEIMIFDLK